MHTALDSPRKEPLTLEAEAPSYKSLDNPESLPLLNFQGRGTLRLLELCGGLLWGFKVLCLGVQVVGINGLGL